jgi:hypothetical protein
MTVYKVAQRWQRTFPFKDILDKPHGHESLVSYTGTMNGLPYWACRICGKPVLDNLTGQPITRKEHLPGYLPGENIPEEQSTGYVFTPQEYESIRSKFSEYMPKCIALVNKYFEYIKDEELDTQSTIRELFEKLQKLNEEIKQPLLDVLYKIEPILTDKGIVQKDVSRLYKLFADINPDYYNFWPDYRISQYIPLREPLSPSGERRMFPEGNGPLFEEKKNLIINYINMYGPTLENILNEFAKPYVGIEGVQRVSHETKLHPICQTCFDENSYHCDEKDCDFVTLDPDDVIDVKARAWVSKPDGGGRYEDTHEQFCKEHGAKCQACGKGLKIEDDDTVTSDNDYYHSECHSEIYTICDECGTEIYREDARYDEEHGVELCANCYDEDGERKAGIEHGIPEEDLDTAKEILQNQDKFFPLDADAIQKSILPTVQLAIKHVSKNPIRPPNEKDYNDIESFIHKRLQKPETKAVVSVKLQDLYTQAVPSTRTTEVDWGQIMKNMEAFFIKNLEEVNRIKTEYPNLKGFKPYPVDIKIESGKNHGGSVFVIYPSEEFLNYAEIIQPGAKEAYDNHIERKGHHRGALAYARFTLSKGNIIIDNLQTDIDVQLFDNDDNAIKKSAISVIQSVIARVNKQSDNYPNLSYKDIKDMFITVSIEASARPQAAGVLIDKLDNFLRFESESLSEQRLGELDKKYDIETWNKILKDMEVFFAKQITPMDPTLQWWVSTIKKFWAPYLLDALRKFAQAVEKKIYLTNYDMQKIKWKSLPERNKDIYDRIPETMNMPVESVKAKPEDLSEKTWDMRRVARKLIESTEEFVRLATE